MSLIALSGACEAGLLFALVALGVYLSFRVLDFPDLTVDGSFPLGAAVAASAIMAGVPPIVATLWARRWDRSMLCWRLPVLSV